MVHLSDSAIEKTLYDTPMYYEFAGLDMREDRPFETHNLSVQILATVNAAMIAKGSCCSNKALDNNT